jgi:hypothetical protein
MEIDGLQSRACILEELIPVSRRTRIYTSAIVVYSLTVVTEQILEHIRKVRFLLLGSV